MLYNICKDSVEMALFCDRHVHSHYFLGLVSKCPIFWCNDNIVKSLQDNPDIPTIYWCTTTLDCKIYTGCPKIICRVEIIFITNHETKYFNIRMVGTFLFCNSMDGTKSDYYQSMHMTIRKGKTNSKMVGCF